MRAEINENGMLTLSPESPLEAFALRQWSDSYHVDASDGKTTNSSVLLIDASWPPREFVQ
jgi:hypothetical protein